MAEATEETIEEINNLSDEDAEIALNEMRRPKQFIRRQGSMQMNLSVQLQTLEDGRIISSRALLDSGSTGSCMSRKFVEKHRIPTTKLARPIPIYNADGTLNKEIGRAHV